MEPLVRTPSIDEAVAHVEAFLHGERTDRLWIVGPPGCGKSFLASWARDQALNGRRGAIMDDARPAADQTVWAVFGREVPDAPRDGTVVHIGPPEYERKRGVLIEWAAARDLSWAPAALEALLQVETNNLTRLRSLADRTAREAILRDGRIKEIDVLRSLSRVGYLDL